jgi:iron complex outermembrane receptor protein
MRKSALARTILLGSSATFIFATPAMAQGTPEQAAPEGPEAAPPTDEPSADAAQGGEEIIVTARRREERLLDTPVAVTSISSNELKRQQATDLSGIQGAVPNLNLVQGRGSSSSANIFIRGVGQPDALQTFDPAVGIYVDGVYISRIQGALFNLYDVERVEVLRGPQGTLYGKNTIGGAINIVSRKPDLNDVTGSASATYGSYDQLLLNGYVSAPLVEDKVAFSLAGVYDYRDGIVEDPLTGKEYNDRGTIAGRAILRAAPSDNFDITLSGDYTRVRTELTLGYPTAPITQIQISPLAVNVIVPAFPYGDYDYEASTSFQDGEGQELDHVGIAATANWDIGSGFTVSSITAYRDLDVDFFIDIDASQTQTGDVFVGVDQDQFSQEFQLKYAGDRLNGVFGLYYLHERVKSNQIAFGNDLFTQAPGVPATAIRFVDDDQKLDSYAAFGQLTYDVTEKLSVTGGMRYTYEKKRYNRDTFLESNSLLLLFLAPPFSFPDDLPAPHDDDTVSFDNVTPSATISYKPTTDTLVYASASKGFKSGGFNGRANLASDITFIENGVPTLKPTFEPETVWTYELGAKGRFFDGMLTLSGALFHSDYEDFQARVGGGNNTGLTGSFPVLNAGKLRIRGAELESTLRPVDPLTLSLSVGYLDAEYKEFEDGRRLPPLGGAAFSCNPTGDDIVCEPAFAPKWTLRGAADYVLPLANGADLTFGVEARHVSKHYLSVDNRPGLTEDGYVLVNGLVRYDSEGRRWYLQGGVKNAFDTLYKTDGQEFSSVANIQTVYFGDPRTWNVTAGVRF